MTVAQLITSLQGFEPEMKVCFPSDAHSRMSHGLEEITHVRKWHAIPNDNRLSNCRILRSDFHHGPDTFEVIYLS